VQEISIAAMPAQSQDARSRYLLQSLALSFI